MYELHEGDREIELRIEDVDPQGVFSEALIALGDVFSEAAAAKGTPVTHEVVLAAADLSTLLADWVRELVRLAEAENFIPERIAKLRLAGTTIRAVVAGERAVPRDLIKAVAYDRVEMAQTEDAAWSATVILHT